MKHWIGLALSVAVLTSACAMEGGSEVDEPSRDVAGPAAGDELDGLGETTQEVAYLSESSWSQDLGNDFTVLMGSSSDRFCFFTTISGRFKGTGEGVRVFVQSGQWRLGGHSNQTGVSATARCVPLIWQGRTLSVSDTFQWNQDDPHAQVLGSTADRACFFTSLTGHFQGLGEFVRIVPSNGQWLMEGGSHQLGIEVLARCLINVQSTGPFDWTQSQGTSGVVMAPVATAACGLTRMTGNFEGDGERISVFQSLGDWRMGGDSHQNDVGGSAVCAF